MRMACPMSHRRAWITYRYRNLQKPKLNHDCGRLVDFLPPARKNDERCSAGKRALDTLSLRSDAAREPFKVAPQKVAGGDLTNWCMSHETKTCVVCDRQVPGGLRKSYIYM